VTANLRKESPTVSNLSRLMKSPALDMVRACSTVVTEGPTSVCVSSSVLDMVSVYISSIWYLVVH